MTFAILFFFLFGLLSLVIKPARRAVAVEWPLFAKPPLTEVERQLYRVLVSALPQHVVLAQVQLSRFLEVRRVASWRTWYNKICQKSADFVVCTPEFDIVVVIELDDSSHLSAAVRKRDAEKDAALVSAGIRLIRWNVKSMPGADRIRLEILERP